jgi:hypothetical protein
MTFTARPPRAVLDRDLGSKALIVTSDLLPLI